MSYTEIYRFQKDGTAAAHAWVTNPWRGAMAIWQTMEQRHLRQYMPIYVQSKWWYHPHISKAELKKKLGYLPSRIGPGTNDAIEEIYDLADDPRIPMHERIVLYTTFDKMLVKKEEIPKVIDAFNLFIGETSLPVQAKILERLMERDDWIAVGWNQNSVVSSNWGNCGGYDEAADKEIPYNCLTMMDHKWLFDELRKNQK